MAGSNVVSPPAGTNLPRRGHQWLDPELRAAIEEAFVDAYRELRGKRPHAALRKRAPVLVAYYLRCRHYDGNQVKRSIGQIVAKIAPELGWVVPRNRREAHDRYRDSVVRALEILEELDWIDGWRSCVKPNGQGEGILVYLNPQAPIAQMDRATRPRPPRRRRGAQHSPLANKRVSETPPAGTTTKKPQGRASARGALRDGRDRAALVARCRAALEAEPAIIERAGVEIVAALPWLAEVDPLDAALVAFELDRRCGADRRVSEKKRRQFDAACRRLGRYGYCGVKGQAAAVAAALDVGGGDWRQWYSAAPATLGGVAHCVRRVANDRRGRELAKRGER